MINKALKKELMVMSEIKVGVTNKILEFFEGTFYFKSMEELFDKEMRELYIQDKLHTISEKLGYQEWLNNETEVEEKIVEIDKKMKEGNITNSKWELLMEELEVLSDFLKNNELDNITKLAKKLIEVEEKIVEMVGVK